MKLKHDWCTDLAGQYAYVKNWGWGRGSGHTPTIVTIPSGKEADAAAHINKMNGGFGLETN